MMIMIIMIIIIVHVGLMNDELLDLTIAKFTF